MKDELKIGSVVGVFRTGMVGEVVKIINVEARIRYHVKVPGESETYLYSKNDLHLFPLPAQENIRNEWREDPGKREMHSGVESYSTPRPDTSDNNRTGNLMDKLKYILKITDSGDN